MICHCMHVAKWLQLCLTLCDPMDYSLPGSSVHGLSSKNTKSDFPFPPPDYLPDPGLEPMSPVSPALAGGFFPAKPRGMHSQHAKH